jgi:cytochrome c oxidase subunit 4
MSEHIVPKRVYFTIFSALIVLTGFTVFVASKDFGSLNVIVAMAVAVTKATLVVLYFMHVRYSTRLIWVIVVAGFFWLAILFAFTFADYWTRGWQPVFFS